MSAMALLEAVRSFGVEIHCEGRDLVIRPGGRLPVELKERLISAKPAIINILKQGVIFEEMQIFSDPDEWREPLVKWLDSTCVLSLRASSALDVLHRLYREWEIARDGVPCTRDVFRALLAELCFPVHDVFGAELVEGLILRTDLEANNDYFSKEANPYHQNSPLLSQKAVLSKILYKSAYNAHDKEHVNCMNEKAITSVDPSPSQRGCGFAVGDPVYLCGASFGAAGIVAGMERGKVVVFWSDLDFVSRHKPDSLILAGEAKCGESG